MNRNKDDIRIPLEHPYPMIKSYFSLPHAAFVNFFFHLTHLFFSKKNPNYFSWEPLSNYDSTCTFYIIKKKVEIISDLSRMMDTILLDRCHQNKTNKLHRSLFSSVCHVNRHRKKTRKRNV